MPDNPKPKTKRACPEPGASRSRRGGKRPGAGAPKGNLNALKHGCRSQQFARVGALLAANPEVRELVFRLAGEAAWRQGDPDLAMDFTFRSINPFAGSIPPTPPSGVTRIERRSINFSRPPNSPNRPISNLAAHQK